MPQGISEQMFSQPENDPSIMSMWELFLQGGKPPSPALRRPIDDSWRRCLQASVDPNRTQAPLTEQSLHSLRDYCAELLDASTPVMALARDFLAETGTVMVLTDAHGTVLNLEGDTSTLGSAENVHLMSGANWSESACGTNAIGTTLAIGKPLQIHSAEHYCEGIKRWSCSATVIRDPLDGSILGALDVSGLSRSYNRQTLALVVSTAGRIESRLTQSELDIRYNLLAACIDRISGSTRDGIILFDRRGRAIRANDKATLMLAELDQSRNSMTALSARLSDLTLAPNRPLPPWMDQDYLEPVLVGGQQVGTLLTLPNREKSSGKLWLLPQVVADKEHDTFTRVIGQSSAIRQTVARARQLAKSQVPILLSGETGVGKEVFAKGIHEAHGNPSAPFVALNCGGFSRELLTSELFGHAEGSFTGAKRGGMIGKIEAANGGTLFLDEIGEMPIDLQPHFLRVLEEGEVYRLGENKPRKVNFRLIAATHRDLRKEIREGAFRMDLFYRIAVTTVSIPPLRERAQDIPLLAQHYIQQLSQRHQLGTVRIAPDVLERLQEYAWPGNIRELRNVIESMLLTAQNQWIDLIDIPPEIFGSAHCPTVGDHQRVERSDLTRMEHLEREALFAAIQQCRGNMTAVARSLGMAKSTVYVKLKRFGLENMVDALRHPTTTPTKQS